jgi:hypothetical protein
MLYSNYADHAVSTPSNMSAHDDATIFLIITLKKVKNRKLTRCSGAAWRSSFIAGTGHLSKSDEIFVEVWIFLSERTFQKLIIKVSELVMSTR